MLSNKKPTNSGITIAEMLVAISIFSLVFTLGYSGFQWFQLQSRINHTLRTITAALNTARYQAIEKNQSIKVCLEGYQLVLKNKTDKDWHKFLNFDLDKNMSVSMNASPVFFPTGFVSPLCSIFVKNDKYKYKVTISIAGRIKVMKIT